MAYMVSTNSIAQPVIVVDSSGNPTTGEAVTIADGANVVEGSTTGTAVTTDANGTIQQYLRGLVVLFVNFLTRLPIALGTRSAATSLAVALSTEDAASLALLAPSTAAGAALTPVVTAALATSKVIKASAGNLYGINCAATTVAGIFLVHNSATAPAAGAVTPTKAYPVGIGQGLEVGYNPPLRFGAGISITFTSATTPFTQTDSATAFIEGDAV